MARSILSRHDLRTRCCSIDLTLPANESVPRRALCVVNSRAWNRKCFIAGPAKTRPKNYGFRGRFQESALMSISETDVSRLFSQIQLARIFFYRGARINSRPWPPIVIYDTRTCARSNARLGTGSHSAKIEIRV